jgi:hypothetical protein
MTKEDVLMMARNPYGIYSFTAADLAVFCDLIAAQEREECAKVCEENSKMFGDSALIGVCRTNAKRIRARK